MVKVTTSSRIADIKWLSHREENSIEKIVQKPLLVCYTSLSNFPDINYYINFRNENTPSRFILNCRESASTTHIHKAYQAHTLFFD